MSALEILLIALGVSVDAFAVSVGGALSCRRTNFRNGLNAGLFFGGFQFFMPLIGFFAAQLMHNFVAAFDHWCAFGLLLLVGGNMVRDAFSHKEEEEEAPHCKLDFFAPKNLVVPAIATSLDALAVGASIAFAGNSVWLPAAMMGVATGVISYIGVELGYRLKSFGGERIMTAVGGTVIILIGIKILVADLMS